MNIIPDTISQEKLLYKTSGLKAELTSTIETIQNEIFRNRKERFINIARFSYQLTNMISHVIIHGNQSDRKKKVEIEIARETNHLEVNILWEGSGTINIKESYDLLPSPLNPIVKNSSDAASFNFLLN